MQFLLSLQTQEAVADRAIAAQSVTSQAFCLSTFSLLFC